MIPAFLSNAASCTFFNTISQVSIEALRETGEVVEKEEKKRDKESAWVSEDERYKKEKYGDRKAERKMRIVKFEREKVEIE